MIQALVKDAMFIEIFINTVPSEDIFCGNETCRPSYVMLGLPSLISVPI